MNKTPSLKQKLNSKFKSVIRIHDDRARTKRVRDLMSMMTSPAFKYTCAHPSLYKIIDQESMQSIYGIHMAVKIKELADAYDQNTQSEFVKIFLSLCMEYFNLTQTTTKREKIKIHRRINKTIDKIHSFEIDHEQWSSSIAIVALQNHVITTLTEAFIKSMK